MLGTVGGDADEAPQHEILLPSFEIVRHCVTNQQYEIFLESNFDQSIPLN